MLTPSALVPASMASPDDETRPEQQGSFPHCFDDLVDLADYEERSDGPCVDNINSSLRNTSSPSPELGLAEETPGHSDSAPTTAANPGNGSAQVLPAADAGVTSLSTDQFFGTGNPSGMDNALAGTTVAVSSSVRFMLELPC